jgi:hypothetical protein
MLKDRYGLPLSTTSSDARDAYVAAVDSMLCADPRADTQLAETLRADPDFALAHAAIARQHQLHGHAAEAQQAIERATMLVPGATQRERQHVDICGLLIDGSSQQALGRIIDHVQTYPLDALALSPAAGVFGLIGFSGRPGREQEQLALLQPLRAAYGDDWWFATVYAFALIEVGEHEHGRELVERALEQRQGNAHGVHVFTHALYEGGDDRTAADYLTDWLPGYPDAGPLTCHLWWHRCLLHLALGDTDAVWSSYDAHCAPVASQSPPINVLTDGVSLLWRARLAGLDGDRARWQALLDYQRRCFPQPGVFVDAHCTLSAVALGDWQAFEADLALLESRAVAGKLPAGNVAASLARAYRDFACERWARVVQTLQPIADEVVRIGGSRAQRDLVTNTLIAAYFRDGRPQDARRLMAGHDGRQRSVPVSNSRGNGQPEA